MRKRLRTICALLPALLAVPLVIAPIACRQEGGAKPATRRIVLVSVDTLRADRLACYGHDRPTSPSIDRLATEGVLFENADAPRGLTWPALTTILTGKYPITHGVRTNGDRIRPEHPLISEILHGRGFDTAAFITNMERAPNRGFDTIECFIDTKKERKTQAEWDRDATDAALAWLERHHEGEFFLWVHYLGPHKPYTPEPPFRGFLDDSTRPIEIPEDYEFPESTGRRIDMEEDPLDRYLQYVTGRGIELDPEEVAYVNALYDGEVLCVDREVGRVLEKLDALGRADDTLVVFVADHGEELYDRNEYFYHSCSVYQSVLHVPLVFRLPGVLPAGRRVPDPVELSDIAPTVLELLGEDDAADEVDGVTLLPLLQGTGDRDKDHVVTEWYEARALGDRRPVFTIREGDWKLVYNPDEVHPALPPYKLFPGSSYPIERLELYNLREDPRERRNVAGEHPDRAARLRQAIESFLASREGKAGTPEPWDRASIERLLEMGYITPEDAEAGLKRLKEKAEEPLSPDRYDLESGREE
jgi:arylsulfatase A-like enzyme